MSTVHLSVIRSGSQTLALADRIQWKMGVQLLEVLDVTDIVPQNTVEIECEGTWDAIDEYGARAAQTVARYRTSGSHGQWKEFDGAWPRRIAHAQQVAIELRPANTAAEQLRQLDDGEAVLAGGGVGT